MEKIKIAFCIAFGIFMIAAMIFAILSGDKADMYYNESSGMTMESLPQIDGSQNEISVQEVSDYEN